MKPQCTSCNRFSFPLSENFHTESLFVTESRFLTENGISLSLEREGATDGRKTRAAKGKICLVSPEGVARMPREIETIDGWIVLGSSANVRPDNFRCGGWIYRGIELPRNFQSLGNYTSSRLPVAFSRSALCKGWHRYDDTAAIPLRLTSEHLLRKIPWNSEAAAKKTTQKFSWGRRGE